MWHSLNLHMRYRQEVTVQQSRLYFPLTATVSTLNGSGMYSGFDVTVINENCIINSERYLKRTICTFNFCNLVILYAWRGILRPGAPQNEMQHGPCTVTSFSGWRDLYNIGWVGWE